MDIEREFAQVKNRLEVLEAALGVVTLTNRTSSSGDIRVGSTTLTPELSIVGSYANENGVGFVFDTTKGLYYMEQLTHFKKFYEQLRALIVWLDDFANGIDNAAGSAVPQDGGKIALTTLATAVKAMNPSLKQAITTLQELLP
jgi:hypothetical protein